MLVFLIPVFLLCCNYLLSSEIVSAISRIGQRISQKSINEADLIKKPIVLASFKSFVNKFVKKKLSKEAIAKKAIKKSIKYSAQQN